MAMQVLQEDRSIKLKIDLASLNVSPWMPENTPSCYWTRQRTFRLCESGTGLETAVGHGNITIANGILRGLAPIRQYIHDNR